MKKTEATEKAAKPAETNTKTEKVSKTAVKAQNPEAIKSTAVKGKFPVYKGRPLVRNGDTIYYGSMKEKYVTCLTVKTKKKVDDLDVADTVTIQLMNTEPDIAAGEKPIEKASDRKGLYLALDIADAWLTRANAE